MSVIVSQQYRKLYFAGITEPQFLAKGWGWKVGLGSWHRWKGHNGFVLVV
jgi:hypothetical protein